MACPHLKEVVMLYCEAYPLKKMLPLDRIVSTEPCLGEFNCCPVFQEAKARLAETTGTSGSDSPELHPVWKETGAESSPPERTAAPTTRGTNP